MNSLNLFFIICLSLFFFHCNNNKSDSKPNSPQIQNIPVQEIQEQDNCAGSLFRKNKVVINNDTARQLKIAIDWVQVYKGTKILTNLSSNLGRDLAVMKTKQKKISLENYINETDSLINSVSEIKVVDEIETLIEKWYCYCQETKEVITHIDNLIKTNNVESALEKIQTYISENKNEDKRKITEIDKILNDLATRYNLYRFRND